MAKSKKPIVGEYNYSYIYKLISDITECVSEKQFKNSMSKYEMSKLIPELQKVLSQVCNESGNY
jgi:hypothetical protein